MCVLNCGSCYLVVKQNCEVTSDYLRRPEVVGGLPTSLWRWGWASGQILRLPISLSDRGLGDRLE